MLCINQIHTKLSWAPTSFSFLILATYYLCNCFSLDISLFRKGKGLNPCVLAKIFFIQLTSCCRERVSIASYELVLRLKVFLNLTKFQFRTLATGSSEADPHRASKEPSLDSVGSLMSMSGQSNCSSSPLSRRHSVTGSCKTNTYLSIVMFSFVKVHFKTFTVLLYI